MASGFGFSAGDFITAIGLTIKIGKALRTAGGAATECSLLLQDLQTLQQILEELQSLRPTERNLSHVNAIRGMALTCIVPLRDFKDKMDKRYKAALGSHSPKNVFVKNAKRVQYALFADDEVARFRATIVAKVVSISLLLGMFNNEVLLRTECSIEGNHATLLKSIAEQRERLEKDMSRAADAHHQDISTKIIRAKAEMCEQVEKSDQHVRERQGILLARMDEQSAALRRISQKIGRHQQYFASGLYQLYGLCAGTGRTAITQRLSARESNHFPDVSRNRQTRTRTKAAGLFQPALSRLHLLRSINDSLWGNLIPFSAKVLTYLRENMRANTEIYTLLLSIQRSMSRGMPMAVQDSIQFTDALGRTTDLPYQYFRHWEVFESRLRCEFKGMPGEHKILRSEYHLMNDSLPGLILNTDNWQHAVFPKTKISMSMIMQFLRLEQQACPRPHCLGVIPVGTDRSISCCVSCGLSLFTSAVKKAHSSARSTQNVAKNSENDYSDPVYPISPPPDNDTAIQTKKTQLDGDILEQERQEILVFRLVHMFSNEAQSLGPPSSGTGLYAVIELEIHLRNVLSAPDQKITLANYMMAYMMRNIM